MSTGSRNHSEPRNVKFSGVLVWASQSPHSVDLYNVSRVAIAQLLGPKFGPALDCLPHHHL